MSGRILFVSGSGGSGTLRYRVRLAEESLRASGFQTAAVHFTDPLLRSWLSGADVLALYRTPATRRLLAAIGAAKLVHRIPVTFDVDDLVFRPEHLGSIPFLGDLPARRRSMFETDVSRRRTAALLADHTSGATETIVAELTELTGAPSRQLPNGVGRVALALADQARVGRPTGLGVRLGYFSGSATHDADWAMIEPAVVRFLAEFPTAELLLVGKVAISESLLTFGPRVRRMQVVPWVELFDLLARVDINLAPLAAGRFAWGKSAIKWLEAALVQTPTVATAAPAFEQAILAGQSGILVPPDGDWFAPMVSLAQDGGLRREMGELARTAALTNFGPGAQVQRYGSYFQDVMSAPRKPFDETQFRAWSHGAARTATLGITLEPYPFEKDLASLTWPAPVGDRELVRGRAVVRRVRSLGVSSAKAAVRGLSGRGN